MVGGLREHKLSVDNQSMGLVQGDLSVMSASDLAIWCANRRFTGELRFARDTRKKSFTVAEGRVTRCSSNDPREFLGQFLVHHGLLTEDQLQRAFETQRETQVLLGRILVMIGIVPEAQIVSTLRSKIRESLLDAFRWRSGTFDLITQEDEQSKSSVVAVEVPLREVYDESPRRQAQWKEFRTYFPHAGICLAVDEARIPVHATPETLDGRLIALARHGLTVDAISMELHARDYQIADRLLQLTKAGAIHPVEATMPGERTPSATADALTVTQVRRALGERRYQEAMRSLASALRKQPGDGALEALRAEAETCLSQDIMRRDEWRQAVPHSTHGPKRALSAKQRYILTRIDGQRCLEAIVQVSPMDDIEALSIVAELYQLGLIGFAD